jgi:hypothetical protein
MYPKLDNIDSRFAPHPQFDAYNRPPSPSFGGPGKKYFFLFVDLAYFSILLLVVVDFDIVRTETANDTPDVELTEMDLLLTPTVVFSFCLNDKI